jgi:hypothetical protein
VSKQSHRALWFNRNLRLDLQARLAVSRAARALAVSILESNQTRWRALWQRDGGNKIPASLTRAGRGDLQSGNATARPAAKQAGR